MITLKPKTLKKNPFGNFHILWEKIKCRISTSALKECWLWHLPIWQKHLFSSTQIQKKCLFLVFTFEHSSKPPFEKVNMGFASSSLILGDSFRSCCQGCFGAPFPPLLFGWEVGGRFIPRWKASLCLWVHSVNLLLAYLC